MEGMVLVFREMLNMSIRYCMPFGPRCFRWSVDILSGPRALEALAVFIASLVFSTVMSWVLLSLFFFKSLLYPRHQQRSILFVDQY